VKDWRLGWLGIASCFLWLSGCWDKTQEKRPKPISKRAVGSLPASRPVVEMTREERVAAKAGTWLPEKAWQESWLAAMVADHQVLLPLLGTVHRDTGRYKAAKALQSNDLMAFSKLPLQAISKLPTEELILRGRIALRMARLYRELYDLNLQLTQEVYERRLALKGKLQAGRLLPLYLGRLLCLLGKEGEAATQWKLAEAQIPPQRKARLALWQRVCSTPKAERSGLGEMLAKLDDKDDPDLLAERNLLAAFFSISVPPSKSASTPRATLYEALTKGIEKLPELSALRLPLDQETIQEEGVDATLEYYDPAQAWLLLHFHAKRAQALFSSAQASDPAALWGIAHASMLLGQGERARQAWKQLLEKPPTALHWPLQLFSSRLTPKDLVFEAHTYLALLQADEKARLAKLQELTKGAACPQRLLSASLWFAQTKDNKAYEEILDCVALMPTLQERIKKAESGSTMGSKLFLQMRLRRYAWRAFYLPASQAALSRGDGEPAMRWMEFLHQKDEPYKIGGDNQAAQMVLTARAYLRMGHWGTANLFFAKNRQDYPSLHQPWVLLGTLRIFRGMGGSVGPKSGG
jgi:hypothetical protein